MPGIKPECLETREEAVVVLVQSELLNQFGCGHTLKLGLQLCHFVEGETLYRRCLLDGCC